MIPDHGINDYKNWNDNNEAILIDDGAPDTVKSDQTIERGWYANQTKFGIAIEKRASAILLRVDRLTYGEGSEDLGVPIFDVQRNGVPDSPSTVSYMIEVDEEEYTTNNVIGYLPGHTTPDSTIIICAHYDHLGAINDSTWFPGANDNASGTAMLLALARKFQKQPLRYTIVFIAFAGEELGLKGSKYYIDHPYFDLKKCRFLLNLDMTASGNAGIMAVGGVEYGNEFEILKGVVDSLDQGEIRKRANAPNSDQFYFLERGIHGFYLYPYIGQQPYHHINDRIETLEWDVFEKIYRVSEAFLQKL